MAAETMNYGGFQTEIDPFFVRVQYPASWPVAGFAGKTMLFTGGKDAQYLSEWATWKFNGEYLGQVQWQIVTREQVTEQEVRAMWRLKAGFEADSEA